jgi:hypothetical protein
MNFREATSEAAHIASDAALAVMARYADGFYTDEDDISPAIIERLQLALEGKVGGLQWQGSIMRHRAGVANEEGRTGADMAIFFELNTSSHKFKKGLLIQAKRSEPAENLPTVALNDLRGQCNKMLQITPASFVFNYARRELRSAPASKISGCTNRNLYGECDWTAYRFFLEFFRSPIGDPRFVSALARDLPIPNVLELSASGEFFND